MRGAFRGMFRFGCSSAYSAHAYSVMQPKVGSEVVDNVEFRSYLHSLMSKTGQPRREEEPILTTSMNEIYPGIRIGEQSLDVAVVVVGLGIVLTIGLGACFVIGWMVDSSSRAARLQLAHEYEQSHAVKLVSPAPNSAVPQFAQSSAEIPVPAYDSRYGSPRSLQSVAPNMVTPLHEQNYIHGGQTAADDRHLMYWR